MPRMPIYGKRILVLIPHPDDEVVGVAAAIARARAKGSRVYALYLGHGCIARDTLWPWQRADYDVRITARMDEAAKAAEFLGLTVVGCNHNRAAREIWPQLEQVMDEVRTAIRSCAPDCIWVPAYEGGNPDHDALNALAATITDIPVYEFAEYHFAGGEPHSNHFIQPRASDLVISLTPEEQKMKREALALYQSEVGNLGAIDVTQESLRTLAPYDYTARPHPGKLWYERFQWVPFKHPRVDYTRAEMVSKAITNFLKRAA